MSNRDTSTDIIISDKLSPQKQRAIMLLLSAKSTSEVAKEINVSQRTIFRWLAEDSDFQQELQESQAAMLSQMTARLVAAQNDALNTLTELMSSVDERIRLKSAVAIIEHLARWYEINVLEKRVNSLEEMAE